MRIYKENTENFENFLIVSFFTKNYKIKADRLIDSLNNFKLNYKVFEVPSIHYSKSENGSDNINYSMPKLILKMINKYKVPILFTDCDMVIEKKPELIFSLKEKKIDFAIYNWLEDPENDGYLPVNLSINTKEGKVHKKYYINKVNIKLINNPDKEKQLFSSGAVAYFSDSNESISFLNCWLENIKSYPKAPDDQVLDYTYNYSSKLRNLKVEWLDKSYCRIYWWIFSDPIINHPGKVHHRSNDNFERLTGKKRFKIENTLRRRTSKFPEEFLLDLKKKNILKVKDKKIYVIRKFKENTYI